MGWPKNWSVSVRSEERVDCRDAIVIEEIEKLSDQIEMTVLAKI